jgi:hypothetical protein
MKITVHIEDWSTPLEPVYLGSQEFDTADVSTFLVAPWPDSDTPGLVIPDQMHIIGFRYFQTENSIMVYVGKGILVKV